MTLAYACEKYGVAVLWMATEEGSVANRLKRAYQSFHTLGKDDFPDGDTWEEHQAIVKGITGDGGLDATTSKLRTRDAAGLAERIVNLQGNLEDAQARLERTPKA